MLGLPAKLAVLANGIAPGLISDLLAAGNEWLLACATGSETASRKGQPNFAHTGGRAGQ